MSDSAPSTACVDRQPSGLFAAGDIDRYVRPVVLDVGAAVRAWVRMSEPNIEAHATNMLRVEITTLLRL
jgi:hypothetical protein